MSDNLIQSGTGLKADAGINYVRNFFKDETWDVEGFIEILFSDNSESFELECQEWLVKFASHHTDFYQIHRKCIELLESSDFLNFYDKDVSLRHDYQEKLTLASELTSYFQIAKELTIIDEENERRRSAMPHHVEAVTEDAVDGSNDGDEEDGTGKEPAKEAEPQLPQGSKEFINDLFGKLKRSGFVYHPRKHINVMMNLFVLKPELMEFSIEELFSIIFTRQIEIWKQYPFRTVMIQALERYIQSTDDKLYALAGNSSAIDNTMRALVVQLTLGEGHNENVFDHNLSIARLYRYASYKVMGKSMQMFSRAYEFLLGGASFGIPMYSLYRSKAVDLIASYLNSEMTNSTATDCDNVWKYENNNVRLQIAQGKILFLPTEINSETRGALPEGLLKWNNVEVRVNDKVDMPDTKNTDILPYKIMWRDIESLLFSKHAVIDQQFHTRQFLTEGDETMITIDSSVDSENNCFVCTILDKNIRGDAYIDLSDIVSYLNHAYPRNFCDAYGYKLKFRVKVDSVDDDGTYHMSMKDGIDEFIQGNMHEGLRLSCSVGDSFVAEHSFQRGITYDGYPMTVRVEEKLERNTRLTAEYSSYDNAYHAIKLNFVDLDPAQKVFTPSEAFQRLMNSYSAFCTQREEEIQQILQAREEEITIPTMQRTHVVELMLIIDRIAIMQQDYLTSYNYLAVARLLARLLGMEDKRSYYSGRMDLIELLNYFAINNEIDEKKFGELESVNGDMFTQNVILRKRFNQVRLISWLGKPEHNLDLRHQWEDTSEDEVISDIAGLALSYNILKQAGLDTQARDVHNQIKNLLNLKGHESSFKNYGAMEDVTCEFKTSIVYVPGAANKFDPDTQMDNILKVVDEMLNTRGGIIYLGVNRYGQGVGLKNDLDNVLFHNDKEEYIRFIYKYISKKISPHAANVLVHIDFDKENTQQDVCIIKVNQSPVGLPFKGEYCVRRGDSVYRYDKEGYEEYRKIRDSIYGSDEEREQTMRDEGLQAVSVKETTQVESIDKKIGNWDKVQASTFMEHISTSMRRMARGNDATPLCYLNFMGRNTYQFSEMQMGNIPLSLPIFADDYYVVIVYSDGTVMYSPTSTLADLQMGVEYQGDSNQQITYVSTAGVDDSLLLVVNTKAGGVMRVQDFDHLKCGSLLCQGRRVVDGHAINVEYIDVVDEDIKDLFKKCRNIDCPLDSKQGQKNMEQLIELQVASME